MPCCPQDRGRGGSSETCGEASVPLEQTFDPQLRPFPSPKPCSCLPQTFKASRAGSIQMLETGRAPASSASHVINHTKTPNPRAAPSLSTQLHREPPICINLFLTSPAYTIILKPFTTKRPCGLTLTFPKKQKSIKYRTFDTSSHTAVRGVARRGGGRLSLSVSPPWALRCMGTLPVCPPG